MFRLTLFLLLSVNALFATNIITIDNEDIRINDFQVEYLPDPTEKLTINDVIKLQFAGVSANKLSFGTENTTIWYKVVIQNRLKESKKIYLNYRDAFLMLHISFYETINNTILHESLFDMNDKNISEKMYGSSARISFLLEPNQQKTIYIRGYIRSHNIVNLSILDERNASLQLKNEGVVGVFIFSALFILALFNFILFLSSRYKEYLYYSLFLSLSSLWTLYIFGALSHYFGIYGSNAFKFDIFLFSCSIFIPLFVKTVFETHKKYPIVDKFLNSVIIIFTFGTIYMILIDYDMAMSYSDVLYQYLFIVVFGSGIYLLRKKDPLAKFFIAANIFLFTFGSIANAFYIGYLPHTFITYYASGFSIVSEALMYALLLSYKIRLLQNSEKSKIEEIAKQNQELIIKSKKAQLGEMISIISHQWKQPLSVIASTIALKRLHIDMEMSDKLTQEEHRQAYDKIDSQIAFMSDTIDEFRHFFNPSMNKSFVNLQKPIKLALELTEANCKENRVELKLNIDLPTQILTYGNDIAQVLINLIKNANEQFTDSITQRVIEIIGYEDDEFSYIKVKDSAGGVPKELQAKIFEQYFSTKNREDGTGLGLDLSKKIVEEKCGGKLTFYNEDNGAVFVIQLNKKQ